MNSSSAVYIDADQDIAVVDWSWTIEDLASLVAGYYALWLNFTKIMMRTTIFLKFLKSFWYDV